MAPDNWYRATQIAIEEIKRVECVVKYKFPSFIFVLISVKVQPQSFQPVHEWGKKNCGMCYPVYGLVHIKNPLLLIRKSSPCGSSGFLSRYLKKQNT